MFCCRKGYSELLERSQAEPEVLLRCFLISTCLCAAFCPQPAFCRRRHLAWVCRLTSGKVQGSEGKLKATRPSRRASTCRMFWVCFLISSTSAADLLRQGGRRMSINQFDALKDILTKHRRMGVAGISSNSPSNFR